MIKANELRIGNWFWCGYNCQYVQIEAFIPKSAQMKLFGVQIEGVKVSKLIDPINLIPNGSLDSIPLTSEILEKCGFELFPWGWVKKSSKDFGVRINLHSYNYEVSGNSPVKLESLHQLQNLYFALTGEELPIKL